MIGKLKLYGIIGLGAVLALTGTYFVGHMNGRSAERQDALEQRLEDAGKAGKVQDEINSLDDGAVRDELDRWMRD